MGVGKPCSINTGAVIFIIVKGCLLYLFSVILKVLVNLELYSLLFQVVGIFLFLRNSLCMGSFACLDLRL